VNYLPKHLTDVPEGGTDPAQRIRGWECTAFLKESWWGGSVLLSRNRYFVDPEWDVCLRYVFEGGAGTVTASPITRPETFEKNVFLCGKAFSFS